MTELRLLFFFLIISINAFAQSEKFNVIAFFTAKHDPAHISFVNEANRWFPLVAGKEGFRYDTTSNWNNLNEEFLSKYQVVIFLDTRPEEPAQRAAFKKYMELGGGWMGFHFAAFALTPSGYNQNWDWYHRDFLGAGQYKSNTWRPTGALLRVENREHPATSSLDTAILAAPNEWYAWELDLTKNKDIDILLSIHPKSFPLGTGPKAHEIWHEGYYPVVWTNRNYKMIYLNMGHNDMDYESGTNETLSYTFSGDAQNRLILDALKWLAEKKK